MVEAGPVLDWSIQYGSSPCVWACTAKAWYKLLSPAAAYAETAVAVQRRLDMSTRLASALAANPSLSIADGQAAAGQAQAGSSETGTPGAPSWDAYGADDLRQEAPFLHAQLTAWAAVR